MHKNDFCSNPNKTLKNKKSIAMSQSTLYKNNENENNKNKNIRKLKESFYKNDFKTQNISNQSKENNESQNMDYFIISQNILKKYNKKLNIGIIMIISSI